jgi:hypothetical protein
MNTFRMGLVMMIVAVGSMLAIEPEASRFNLRKHIVPNVNTGVSRIGRNYVAAAINQHVENSFAKSATATTLRIAENYCIHSNFNSKKSLGAIVQEEVPYFVVNGLIRSADNRYDIKNVLKKCDIIPNCRAKEMIKDTVNFVPEVTEETVYDLATAATVTAGYYAMMGITAVVLMGASKSNGCCL